MKTIIAILFLFSVAGSQVKTVQQSSKLPRCFVYSRGAMSQCIEDKKRAAELLAQEDELWRWQVSEAEKKSKLYWALRTRVLTDKEMAEVEQYDYHLLTRTMEQYMPAEVKAEFNQALLIQYKIRDIAHRAQRCAHSGTSGKPDTEQTK